MRISTAIIPICLAASVVLTISCLRSSRPRSQEEPAVRDAVLARVGHVILLKSDVAGIYNGKISPEDSARLVGAYVDGWVRRQVKVQEAEELLKNSGVDIDAMVNDYRNSLLTLQWDKHCIESYVDTLITESEIAEYYESFRKDFLLDNHMVKGRIVKLPDNYRQKVKLKELMGSPTAEKQQDFMDMCRKNNFLLTTFDSWTDYRDYLSYLPVVRGSNMERFLSDRRILEMADGENRYYFHISQCRKQGEQAPVELVGGSIRRIIYNQRSREVIRRHEDSLYVAALEREKVEVFVKPE